MWPPGMEMVVAGLIGRGSVGPTFGFGNFGLVWWV